MTSNTAIRSVRSRSPWAERLAHALPYVLFAAAMLLLDSISRGATQEEFFRSVQQSVRGGPGGGTGEITMQGLGTFLGVIALIVALLVLVQRVHRRLSGARRSNVASPARSGSAAFHQPKKLAREVARAVGLSGEELRQLKAAADEAGHASPLTLLVCPSLLMEAARREGTAADTRTLARLARRVLRM